MTLENYLKDYIDEMSDSKHSDILGCIKEAYHGNARLREILVLYVIEAHLESAFVGIESKFDKDVEIIQKYMGRGEPLPKEYERILARYKRIKEIQ